MRKLEIKIIWVDQSETDFVEIQINIVNERLSALFSCYASLEGLKKQWQKDLITQVLSGENQQWKMQGPTTEVVSFFVEKAETTGQIALISRIVFEENKKDEPVEECTMQLILDPSQLDSFCEQIQQMKIKIGQTASIN